MTRPRSPRARLALWVMVGVGGYLGLTIAALAITALSVRPVAREAVDVATAGADAARAGEATTARQQLETAAAMFSRVSSRMSGWWLKPGQIVPGVRQNQQAMRSMAAAGRELSQQAALAAAAADQRELGIRQGAVDLGALDSIRRSSKSLAQVASAQHASVQAEHSVLLLPPVSRQRHAALDTLAEIADEATDLSEMARLGAGLLGADEPRRYFLALMTPSELRGAGGMIGNYGVLVADAGQLRLEELGRTVELNAAGDPGARTISGPPDYLSRYSRFQPAISWQNVTMSPDFPSVGTVIEELYPQSGGSEIDGVIGLDPAALASFLKLTGPVSVPSWPVPITSDNAEPVLLYEQYVRFRTPDRVEFLAEVVDATFDKLTSGGVEMDAVADALGPAARARSIQLHSPRPDEQALFRRLDLHGGMAEVAGDYLGVVNQNASGSKIDRFLKRSLTYEAEFDPATSTVSAVAEVTLENRAPPSGLPDYVIRPHPDAGSDDLPAGTNRTYMSLYSPLEVEEVTINGQPAAVTAEQELGRNVFSIFYDLPPESVTVVRYRLQGRITSGDYRLDVRSQVFASEPEEFSFRLTGAPGWIPEEGGGLAREATALALDQRLTKSITAKASFVRR